MSIDTTEFAGPILAWWTQGGRTRIPIVSLTCKDCGRTAPLGGDGVRVARINGDSRYGYGTYHTTPCSLLGKTVIVWTRNNVYVLAGGRVTGGILGPTGEAFDEIAQLEPGVSMFLTHEDRGVLATSPVTRFQVVEADELTLAA